MNRLKSRSDCQIDGSLGMIVRQMRRQAFKVELQPNQAQQFSMRQFAGCCRFLWNKALAFEKEYYEQSGKRHTFFDLCKELTGWKQQDDCAFLNDVNRGILNKCLKDLDQAYKNFFAKRAGFPKFKKKGVHDAFCFPAGFKIDEEHHKIYLPKIGWVKHYKDRAIVGTPKNVTVSLCAGKWYASIQTEREVELSVHSSKSSVGIDLGIARFATLSDGTYIEPLNSFRKWEKKLAKCQRKLAKKVKFSSNWKKQKVKLQKIYHKISNVRNDFLHKNSTIIANRHALVVMEDLKVSNMSKSASGTIDAPGRNVAAKSGLNKSILDQGWFEFRRQLGYKLDWKGGHLILIPPQYTSQACSQCGYVDKENRKTQARFKCMACGYEDNADHNAALNILRVGLGEVESHPIKENDLKPEKKSSSKTRKKSDKKIKAAGKSGASKTEKKSRSVRKKVVKEVKRKKNPVIVHLQQLLLPI